MNQPDKQKLKQAQALLQQGRKAQAHAILLDLSRTNPDESAVWLWLAYTADDLIYAGSYLQRVKRIDPHNPALPDAEEWLAYEESRRYSAESNTRKPAMPLQEALNQIESKPRSNETRLQHARRTGKIPEEPAQLATRTQPKKHRSRTGLKISLFFLLFYLVLGGLLAYIIASNSKLDADSLRQAGFPVYPGAVRLTLTPQDRDTLIKSYGASQPQNSRDLEFEFYKLKKSEQYTALTYYDTEMRNLGWEPPAQDTASSDSFNLKSYHKDKQYFFVFTSEIPGNASPLQSIRSQVTSDDLLLIVFHTEEI